MDDRTRRLAWIVLFIPFLCPELWTGYAWSGFALRLAGTDPSGICSRRGCFHHPRRSSRATRRWMSCCWTCCSFFEQSRWERWPCTLLRRRHCQRKGVYCRELALGRGSRRFEAGAANPRTGWEAHPTNARRGARVARLCLTQPLARVAAGDGAHVSRFVPGIRAGVADRAAGLDGVAVRRAGRRTGVVRVAAVDLWPVVCQIDRARAGRVAGDERRQSLPAVGSAAGRMPTPRLQIGPWIFPIVAAALLRRDPADSGRAGNAGRTRSHLPELRGSSNRCLRKSWSARATRWPRRSPPC